MLAPSELERLAEVCTLIGNEVADENGFVTVHKLLARFHASLLVRPLLVEGMLAFVDRGDTNLDSNQWAVLLDSETYQVSEADIEKESHERPLPSRLRNTIAHELVHSLAFRSSEFGIQLRKENENEESQYDLVREIERETERLSPLLLWSDKALAKLLSNRKESLSVQELDEARQTIGISRHVLINRFRLLRSTDPNGFLNRSGLKDIAIGLAEWVDGKIAVLRSWPLFVNFDRNIMPAFFIKISNQDRLPAKAAFPDEIFAMCGGPNNVVEFVTDVRTEAAPTLEKMKVECSVGQTDKRKGAEFLFVVRKSK
jgi:hypothetical protein